MTLTIEKAGALDTRVSGGQSELLRVTFSDGAIQHYRASYIPAAFDTGKPETLIFSCDENGVTSDWNDVAGGMHMSIDQAIEDLRAVLNEDKVRTINDTPMMQNAGGNPFIAMINTLTSMSSFVPDGYYEDDDE